MRGWKPFGYRLAQWLSTTLPPARAFSLAEGMADGQWRRASNDRRAVAENLSVICGRTIRDTDPMVREVFRHFGRYLVEFMTMHRMPASRVRLEGAGHLIASFRRHGCAIALTGHLGNWEVGAMLVQRMGFPVSVIALPHDDAWTDRFFNTQRRRCGVEVIPLGVSAARQSLRRLREGQVLGVLGDRVFRGEGLLCSVDGIRMSLPLGPAILSRRAQAPIVPVFLVREQPGRFRFFFEPPLEGSASVEIMTQAYAEVLARYLRRFPEQWLMFQPIR